MSHDHRSTIVRPSFDRRSTMLKLVTVLALLLTIGVGNVWGALSSPYECTFTSGMSMSGSDCTTGDVTWTVSTTTGKGSPSITFGNQNTQSCIKFGSGKNHYYSSITLTTSAFSSYNVSSVVLYISSNNGGSKTVTVSQGATTIGTGAQSFSSTTWVTGCTRNTTAGSGGNLTITISSDATATFIHSIKVTYSAPSCTIKPTVGSSLTSVSATASSITATVPISSIGGCNITENGLVYSTSVAEPTVGAANCYTVTTTACGGTAANKTVTISDLACGTSHYVCGYAKNAAGTSYTNVTTQSTSACPLYTVTLMDDSDTRTQGSYGAAVTLPSRTGCTGYTFAGWTKSWVTTQTTWTTTAPTIIPAGSYTPSADENLYPVYTKTEAGSGFSSYTKVTSAPSDWSGQYLLSTGTYTATGEISSSHLTRDTYTPGTTEANAREFTLTKVGTTGYSLKIGTSYIGYANSSTNFATSSTAPTSSSTGYLWTPSTNGITNVGYSARKIADNGSTDFRPYSSPSSGIVYLYKRNEGGSTTSYISVPNCCTPLGSINGSVNLTQGGNSVTISGWSDVANVGTYTVRMYKKNGASWDPVSGTTSGGSAGTQGTRTGITGASKSVTYTGLEVESEYKFTVQAIAGSAAYCDGEETDVTNINSTDVSSTPFKFRYSICIDNGSGSGWAHHYITSTGNTDEGSITINLPAHVDCYQFKIYGGSSGNWGQTGTGKIEGTTTTAWTLNGGNQVYLKTGAAGDYVFTVDYSGTTNPKVSVTYPSADQDEGYVIYYDNSVLNWSSLYYRIGNNSNCSKVDAVLVTGTDKFYKITTPDYDNMDAWHIANNYGWTGSNSIYRTKTNSTPAEEAKAITNSISFQQYVVTGDITVIPTTTHSTGGDTGDAGNNNCEFYTINTPTSGMLTHNIAVGTAAHGTLVATYTNTSGTTGQTVAEGANADLAHRCIVTITATPDAGYSCTSLTVNGAAFTSGNEHILTADATIAATFTAQTSTVTLDNNDATSGSQQTVSATYDATMPLTTTSSAAVAALSRTGYTFTGWWDATSGGTQYYSYNAGTSTLSSARTWDKTGAQTLKAQWSINSYTLTWAWGGGSTSAASGEDYTAAGSVAYNTALVYPANNTMSRNGYTFTGWSSSATNMPAEALTITAQWEAKQYTVTLDNKSATTSGSTSVTATFDAILPTIIPPTKDGYRFDGYWTEASGGTKYINADGTGATAYKKYSAGEHKLHAHWVAQLTFSVNGVIDDELTRDDNTAMPSTATVPTACGDCWAFMGWSTNSSESGAPAYAGGATHEFGEPTTLYAVFGKTEYKMITDLSDIEANEYYVLSALNSNEFAMSNTTTDTYYATSVDITSDLKENADGWYLYNPPVSVIWKFTGTTSSGRLYNEAASKYLDLSSNSATILQSSTSDYLKFTKFDSELFNIASTTQTSYFLYMYSGNKWSVDNVHDGFSSCYIYKRQSATYATVPNCETYDIVWKVNGTPLSSGSQTEETNECTGIEDLPANPEDDALECATKFVGWSEYTLTGTGKSAPADLFTDAADAPAIDADKTFHAVFATTIGTAIAPIEDSDFSGAGEKDVEGTYCGMSFKLKTVGKYLRKQSIWTSSDMTNVKVRIRVYHVSNSTADVLRVSLIGSDGNEVVGADLSTTKYGTSSSSAGYSDYVELTPTAAVTGYKVSMKTSNSYGTGINKIEREVIASGIKDYMTTCCDELVTLSDPTITDAAGSGATITFDKSSPVATCGGETTVTATLTLPAGYEATALSFSGGSVSVSPEISLPVTTTTVYTLTFDANTNATLTTTATIAAKTANAWNWTYNGGAIPDPLVLYVGINKQLDVTYEPADLLNTQKNYTVTRTDAHVAQVGKAYDHYTMRGAAGVTEVTNSTVTFSLNGLSQTVNVTVKPQPRVHFVDIVHGESFADVGPAVESYVATFIQPTPTHSDVSDPGENYNSCERGHLHLVGWIESTWADAHPGATSGEITGAGSDIYYEAGASINVEVQNGKTFYAVWCIVE